MVLAIAARDQLPRRRASGFAFVLVALLVVALMLAALPVTVGDDRRRLLREPGRLSARGARARKSMGP
jgi:heme exporter protein D